MVSSYAELRVEVLEAQEWWPVGASDEEQELLPLPVG